MLLLTLLQDSVKLSYRENISSISLQSFLRLLISNSSFFYASEVSLSNPIIPLEGEALIEVSHYAIQFRIIPNRNANSTISTIPTPTTINSYYEFIIIDRDDENRKRMAVLTADGLESELVEMDCSGMKENAMIDLNEGGRRWEGGEWNGKPFGFGCEYSEEGNLVYEGFVFEGKKVCFGKEWNDDGNNNCLMYEGGYCNDKRWGQGISYDLNGNVDFEG